jgi:hypothetical protein
VRKITRTKPVVILLNIHQFRTEIFMLVHLIQNEECPKVLQVSTLPTRWVDVGFSYNKPHKVEHKSALTKENTRIQDFPGPHLSD